MNEFAREIYDLLVESCSIRSLTRCKELAVQIADLVERRAQRSTIVPIGKPILPVKPTN